MLSDTKIYWISLTFVFFISSVWFLNAVFISNISSLPSSIVGIGFSIDAVLQKFLVSNSPFIFYFFYLIIFPIIGYLVSYSIFTNFLGNNWSILFSLVFFSNVYGYPLHEFITFQSNESINQYPSNFIKYSTLSTLVGLMCLQYILSPQFIYKLSNNVLWILICSLILLNAMDAMAISIVYFVSTVFRVFSYKLNLKREIIPISILFITWSVSVYFGIKPEQSINDAKNIFNYIILYFITPLIVNFISFIYCEVDIYQVLRRFFGLALVMISEICILLFHYSGIFEFSILELQFLSIYNIFHILYFVPAFFWLSNNRKIFNSKVYKNILSVYDLNKLFRKYLPLFGIIISIIYNVSALSIGSELL